MSSLIEILAFGECKYITSTLSRVTLDAKIWMTDRKLSMKPSPATWRSFTWKRLHLRFQIKYSKKSYNFNSGNLGARTLRLLCKYNPQLRNGHSAITIWMLDARNPNIRIFWHLKHSDFGTIMSQDHYVWSSHMNEWMNEWMNELFIDLFSIAIIVRQNLVIHNLSITNGNACLHFWT